MRKFGLAALLLTGLAAIALLLAACQGQTGTQGAQGPAGAQGAPGAQGQAGLPGAQGPAGQAGPQGSQGPAGAVGAPGQQGPAGPAGAAAPLPPGTERQVNISLAVSKPANGTHFVAGEAPVLTVTVKDQAGKAFSRADDFSQLRLMASGPLETADVVTPVKLLKTSGDRTQAIHHYVDLKTNADVQVNDTVLTYKLAAVSDEKPGTYTASVWALSKAAPLQQGIALADFQVGAATAEKPIVEKEKCASCHLGANSGKFYFHHIDQGAPVTANWSLDQAPVTICKTCHNNDGYSATLAADGKTRNVPSPIVKKVHGVHMGEELKNPANIDPTTGLFRFYTGVVFPANVKNCTACHVDDRWKTKPSRLACGTCHDAIDFATGKSVVAGGKDHAGGPQANDAACTACHTPDAGLAPISVVHKVEELPAEVGIDIKPSAPANGKFYVAGEKPTITISMKDSATGAVVDPNTVLQTSATPQPNEWNRVYLFVSGPREGTKPVLTTKAAEAGPAAGSYASNELRVLKDATKEDPKITRTSSSIIYQLDDVAGLEAGTYTAFVQARKAASNAQVSTSVALINFQVGTATPEPQVATNCTTCHGNTKMHGSYPFALAPDICKNCHDYKRQITGLPSGWTNAAGTPAVRNQGYGAAPLSRRVHGVHFGAYLDKPEEVHRSFDYSEVIFPQDVRNCAKCHAESTTWKEKPSRVACLACHDTDKAITHAALNITDATPAEPYSGDEVETCAVCHGKGREFSPDKVHNISNPFKPPYPRE